MDPRLSDSEARLRDEVRHIADGTVLPAAASLDAHRRLPPELLETLAEAGVAGFGLPEEHGGRGGGLLEIALLLEELGRASASLAAALVGHLAVVGRGLARHGSDTQRRHHLPAMIRGERWAAFAAAAATLLEDPGAGVEAESEGDDVVLSGELPLVGGATVAGLFLVVGRLQGADEGGGEVALYLVDREAAGLVVDEEPRKLGLNGSGAATVRFDGVRVKPDSRLAAADRGSEILEELLDAARLAYAAVAVGVAQAALDAALERVLAGGEEGRLAESQAVQWMLADSATETEAARLLTWYAATQPVGPSLRGAAAMARLVASDTAVQVARRAVQVFGGAGGLQEHPVERLYRDAKVLEIHQGASEAQRLAVARQLLPELVEPASGET